MAFTGMNKLNDAGRMDCDASRHHARVNTIRKLAILADAAKYDASCASSGANRRDSAKTGGIGSTEGMGICHSYTPDGRCVSLLKILLTNFCVFDCAYCVNRVSSNVPRARFATGEVVRLTLDFYKRNYIEGLFLSSGIIRSPDYMMEQVVEVARRLREEHDFRGYIHLKTIPEAAPELLQRAGQRHARGGRLQGDGAAHRALSRRAHRHGHADQALHVLLGVHRIAVAADALQFLVQRFARDQRLGRVALQRQSLQQGVAALPRQESEEQLAARRAMQRHARAGPQFHAQRKGAFHAVEIDHVGAAQGGEVAAFADVGHQLAQHRMAHALLAAGGERVLGHPEQARGERIAPAARLARQPAALFQLPEHAVHAGLGPAGGGHGIDIVKCEVCVIQRFFHYMVDMIKMRARGDFRHHTTIGLVLVYLRQHHVGENLAFVGDDGGCGFITAGFYA